ncbi:RNA polymerase sigma factor [Mucilaginibacter flavus]|uniref:RNA polymerase sigma factor n=1 Tax=Mucilaginibacter flavus TaxID=931504 RepID=UPI0025B3C830|nr:RNA polymerase sigma-70 factor [Mucilaginibacter flavus]MDN3582628.1 RNA polymerase sigma-70 factor [Mucilaginibacter flavus]
MGIYQSKTDLQLIHLLKDGDEAAFEEIYTRYAENLAGFAASKLFRLEDARDIIHDLFVKLWEDRLQLEIKADLKSYLFVATRYRVIDHIRKNITREDYSVMVQSLQTSFWPDAHQQLEAKELKRTVDESLNDLSPRVREVYQLSREQHLSIPEIAQQLNISEQTVKNQLTTALAVLRKSLPFIAILWEISNR